jgi:hypothetical protein
MLIYIFSLTRFSAMPIGHCPTCYREITVSSAEIAAGLVIECAGCGTRFSSAPPQRPRSPELVVVSEPEHEREPARSQDIGASNGHYIPYHPPRWYHSPVKAFALLLAALLTANLICFIAFNICLEIWSWINRELDQIFHH